MGNTLPKLSMAIAASLASLDVALSQVSKPERATGPTGTQFMNDMGEWFSSHQGAAIAMIAGAVVVVGMIVYNRIYPSR